jgi:hypothetical protein
LHRTLHEGPFTFKIVEHPSVEAKRTWWKRILATHAERSKPALQAAAPPHEKDGETAEKAKAKKNKKKKKGKEKKKEKKEKTNTKKKKTKKEEQEGRE